MKLIDSGLLKDLSSEAKQTTRLRKNFNFHEVLSDPLQRMLNAMEPNTYVQPHKHEEPDKREMFIILKGKALVVTFNDIGTIEEHTVLTPKTESFGVEIPPKVWHTLIILSEDTVLFEIKDGPYVPLNDKNFAAWAPNENSPSRFDFNRKILDHLNL